MCFIRNLKKPEFANLFQGVSVFNVIDFEYLKTETFIGLCMGGGVRIEAVGSGLKKIWKLLLLSLYATLDTCTYISAKFRNVLWCAHFTIYTSILHRLELLLRIIQYLILRRLLGSREVCVAFLGTMGLWFCLRLTVLILRIIPKRQ
jgi:hypothetical protein